MAVPRNRHSNSRKNNKRSHQAKKPVTLTSCSSCEQWCKPHCVCPHCGKYKGRSVLQNAQQATGAAE
jgi:large subunit ribosomal protein L32